MVKGFDSSVRKAMNDAARDLTTQVHAHILEEVQSKLHSTRQKYIDALSYKQVDADTWVIELGKDAMFIEEGLKPNTDMLDGLLKSPKAKTAKDGCVLNPRNKVLTSLGWKPIAKIVPGDLVLTHSGKFREVKELLVRETPLGTPYVQIKPYSIGPNPNHGGSELTCPSLSLTEDHPVLTPDGWKSAGELKRGDLIATPADLKRRCKECGAPLPINALKIEYCLNNRCARKAGVKGGRLLAYSKEERSRNAIAGNAAARALGVFDRADWGARNPKTLARLRSDSAAAMRRKVSSGEWEPEVFFEKCLAEVGLLRDVHYKRESPIVTDRVVNAGQGRTRNSTLFLDFLCEDLKLVVELDGKHWHDRPDVRARDAAKNKACDLAGYRVIRIPSHEIYKKGGSLAQSIKTWDKNHSGELGVAWVKVGSIKRGVVKSRQHVYAKKYDICLEAEEHSFCCETVFIHNSRYIVVPFQHNKGATQQTAAQTTLTDTIKSEMKKRKIPYGKLEHGADGKPKTGLLHSFDIMKNPIKTAPGAGSGHGPIGAVKQGATGIPHLQGVRVYQTKIKDAKGKESVKKSIMTFRVASSKMKGQGRWVHPGLEAKRFLDEAASWALKEFESRIKDQILVSVVGGI